MALARYVRAAADPLTHAPFDELAANGNSSRLLTSKQDGSVVTEPLNDWTHNVTDVPSGGLDREREATESERSAIAEALRPSEAREARCALSYQVRSGGGYRLSGKVTADVEQACVVTLDPVTAKVEAPFDVEFRPQVETADNDEDASVLSGPDVDILERGIVPVGRIVFETVSASLDPYPRRPGAEFNWQDPQASEPEKASPFAALSKLKDKTMNGRCGNRA